MEREYAAAIGKERQYVSEEQVSPSCQLHATCGRPAGGASLAPAWPMCACSGVCHPCRTKRLGLCCCLPSLCAAPGAARLCQGGGACADALRIRQALASTMCQRIPLGWRRSPACLIFACSVQVGADRSLHSALLLLHRPPTIELEKKPKFSTGPL